MLTSKIIKETRKISFNSILIHHEIIYDAVIKKTPLLCLVLKGQENNAPRFPASVLTAAISSHCLAALPAKMSAFNSDMRRNAYYRSLK